MKLKYRIRWYHLFSVLLLISGICLVSLFIKKGNGFEYLKDYLRKGGYLIDNDVAMKHYTKMVEYVEGKDIDMAGYSKPDWELPDVPSDVLEQIYVYVESGARCSRLGITQEKMLDIKDKTGVDIFRLMASMNKKMAERDSCSVEDALKLANINFAIGLQLFNATDNIIRKKLSGLANAVMGFEHFYFRDDIIRLKGLAFINYGLDILDKFDLSDYYEIKDLTFKVRDDCKSKLSTIKEAALRASRRAAE